MCFIRSNGQSSLYRMWRGGRHFNRRSRQRDETLQIQNHPDFAQRRTGNRDGMRVLWRDRDPADASTAMTQFVSKEPYRDLMICKRDAWNSEDTEGFGEDLGTREGNVQTGEEDDD